MKSASICLLFILFAVNAIAQKDPHISQKDTINIRGYIFDVNGMPAIANVGIKVGPGNFYTLTNKEGYFEIKGAQLNDTIFIYAPTYWGRYYNKGARFAIITLPPQKIDSIPARYGFTKRIVIEGVRKHPDVKPVDIKYQESLGMHHFEDYPFFPGGKDKFTDYVNTNLIYPNGAIEHNVQGTVEATFTVSKDGSLQDIKIIKGLGYGCDEAVIEVLKHSPKWRPGIFNGQPIYPRISTEVVFKLKEK